MSCMFLLAAKAIVHPAKPQAAKLSDNEGRNQRREYGRKRNVMATRTKVVKLLSDY